MVKLKRPTLNPGLNVPSDRQARLEAREADIGTSRDPRWALLPQYQLSPAWTWTLMVGGLSPVRLRGWVAQVQAGVYDESVAGDYYGAAGDQLWAIHGPSLTATASQHNFTPFWVARQPPSGPGFEQWRREFLRLHSY
jgi:hypothetical protein